MNDATPPNRCRIVLIAPPGVPAARIANAFDGGDVASLILPENGMDEASFQAFAEQIVPTAQAAGVAGIIAGISPCILPVLPVILVAGARVDEVEGATSRRAARRRPFLVIAGLVISFSFVILVGAGGLSA